MPVHEIVGYSQALSHIGLSSTEVIISRFLMASVRFQPVRVTRHF